MRKAGKGIDPKDEVGTSDEPDAAVAATEDVGRKRRQRRIFFLCVPYVLSRQKFVVSLLLLESNCRN
jgi:hypothetical protein